MKALVYHGPGRKAWEAVSDPGIEAPTGAIVRFDDDDLRHRPALRARSGGGARGRSNERKAQMKGTMLRAAGKIEDGATVEIVAKAQPTAGASIGPGSPEYTVMDEAGHEAVDTRDFELLR